MNRTHHPRGVPRRARANPQPPGATLREEAREAGDLHGLLGMSPDQVDAWLRARGVDPREEARSLRAVGREAARAASQARYRLDARGSAARFEDARGDEGSPTEPAAPAAPEDDDSWDPFGQREG